MKILAVDSCSRVATCAVLSDGELAAESVLCDQINHSVKLLPQIEQTLSSLSLTPMDIDYFAVTTGPGSFTGQRIGVSTVKALAHAANKPCVPVSSLLALAYNVPFFNGLTVPVMDARREQVYTATFRGTEYVKPERAMALSDLMDELDGPALFVGDGVAPFKEKIAQRLGGNAVFAPDHLVHLRGGSVAAAAAGLVEKGETVHYRDLTPFYLRLSQAEREYNEKHKL